MTCYSTAKWFALQTKPFGETSVAEYLSQKGIRVFLPQTRQERRVCGILRRLTRPLFSGYLFACFNPDASLDLVRYAPRVLRVVGNNSLPVPVPDEIIESIRARMEPDGFVRVERPNPKTGDKVIVEQGRFAGWIGRVERECDDRKRVVILLECLHQAWLVVETRFASLAVTSS